MAQAGVHAAKAAGFGLSEAARPRAPAIGRLAWGRGSYGSRFHATPQMALCLRDHGLTLPPDLTA